MPKCPTVPANGDTLTAYIHPCRLFAMNLTSIVRIIDQNATKMTHRVHSGMWPCVATSCQINNTISTSSPIPSHRNAIARERICAGVR